MKMENLASLFAVPLALVAEDAKEKQKPHQVLTHTEANQKESTTDSGSAKPAEVEVPHATGEIKLNNDHREVGGNKTSPKKKKKKKKKQNKQMQVREYIDYDRKTAEEAQLLNSSQWMWNDVSASAARNQEYEKASSFQREIVSYDELMNPRVFRKNARWRGKPKPEEGPGKSDLASGDALPSVLRLPEAPSLSIIESVTRTDTVSIGVESNNPSSVCSEIKVHEYIDYDKKLVDDAELHDPFAQERTNGFASVASNHDDGVRPSPSSSQQRAIISYAELSPPRNFGGRGRGGPRGMGQNFHVGQHNPGNGVPNGAFKRPSHFGGPPNKMPRLIGGELMIRNQIPLMRLPMMMPCGFVDPNVTATEKKEIFAKPQPVVDPNAPKPMSSKKRRKMAQAKFYKEKQRLQLEKEKNRITTEKPQCRFFSYGSCSKGDDCPFSHDFVPPKKPELCKFYVINTCERGDSCVYYHNDWPCKFFHLFHSCTQGDACRFSHKPLTDETRPLLEKTKNDGIQICDSSSKPLDFKLPVTGQDLPPVTAIKEEAPRILGDTIPTPVPFYGVENFTHAQTIIVQMPSDASDPGFDSILQDPWSHKLKPIDLDETHRPQLPSGVQSQDPRTERYRTTAKPAEASILCGAALIKCEPSTIGYDCNDSFRESKFSSAEPMPMRNGFGSNGRVFYADSGALPDPGAISSTEKSTNLSSSSSSIVSAIDGSHSGELRMKAARHLSLPLTRNGARGIGDGRFPRNGVVRAGTPSNGMPLDPALPQLN